MTAASPPPPATTIKEVSATSLPELDRLGATVDVVLAGDGPDATGAGTPACAAFR